MNIIVPMAGMGKRLRPHTLTTPKPLLQVAGKPIVQRLVEDICALSTQKVNEIAFVVGRFGEETERNLVAVAEALGAKGSIHYQDEPLGTAHAILCAASALSGPVTVAFADTLFKADFQLDETKDGVLWVQKIEDPRQFGVVLVNNAGVITDFKEKPQAFVSDLAMIGIYYFKDGEALRRELQYLIDNDIRNGSEYQLPDALRNMMKQGMKFATGTVDDWMDCGNKEAVVDTNRKVLEYNKDHIGTDATAVLHNCVVVPPCYIGPGAHLTDSVIGPFASIGAGCIVVGSVVRNSILASQSTVRHALLEQTMTGQHVHITGTPSVLSIGDYSHIRV
jgi:glucose-1-phosphate thymidylyltransferase